MEGHHMHNHARRHLHGGAHHLSARVPTPAEVQPAPEMARRAAPLLERLSSRLLARTDCTGTNASSSECEKPAGSVSLTIPITIAVVVPIVLALGVLFYLHRRGVKKQRLEDDDARYKSMDFGLDPTAGGGKGGKRKSAFFGAEKEMGMGMGAGHTKGLSMDMNLSSPYLLPPGLQQSRESLHSLARTLHQNEDPYRSVGSYMQSDSTSVRSYQKGMDRDSSIYTGKTYGSGGRDSSRSRSIQTLPPRQGPVPTSPLPQIPPPAQEPLRRQTPEALSPQSAPSTRSEFRFTDDEPALPQIPAVNYVEEHVAMPHMPEIKEPAPVARKGLPQTPQVHDPRPVSYESIKVEEAVVDGLTNDRDSSALPAADLDFGPSVGGLGILDGPQAMSHVSSPSQDSRAYGRPSRKDSTPVVSEVPSDYSDYANHFQLDLPDHHEDEQDGRGRQMDRHAEAEQEHPRTAGLGVPQQDNKRLSVGFRPLPPDDYLESEDPEYRANRIRSFYKEYFDDGKEQRPPMPQPQQAQYYEDYDAGYLGDATYFDPESNAFVMPYAEPVTRRAMTPPPNNRRQMPPRPRGPPGPNGMPMPRGPVPQGRSRAGSMMSAGPPGRPRAGSTMSGGRFGPMSPRPGSSASARMAPHSGPKKALPPPSPLSTLPTPSKLRDDSFALLGSIDFAPPPTFKDQARGRSQSPLGERRPYQLTVAASSPLVSAFDDIPALPSPHMMRKSGTFTALDFAPPRRFKDADTMSDAGSVRSMGSGISSRNLGAIRNGAGRVSRLPEDQVFTQAVMGDTLKPKWGMRDS